MDGEWGYLVVWEFRVKAEMQSRFELAYSPAGVWAQLFKGGEGFVRTELSRDLRIGGRYLTLDFWTSREAYEEFRRRHAERYRAIDEECEALTESEREIGSFEPVTGQGRFPGT